MLWNEELVTIEFDEFGVFAGGDEIKFSVVRRSNKLPQARYRVRLIQEELVFGLIFVQERKDTELGMSLLERGEVIDIPDRISGSLRVPELISGTYQGQCVTCRYICVLECSTKVDHWEELTSKEVTILGSRAPQDREAVMQSITHKGLKCELWADFGSVRAGDPLRLTLMLDIADGQKASEKLTLPKRATIHIATIEEGKVQQSYWTRVFRKVFSSPWLNPAPGLWYLWPRTILWREMKTLEFNANGVEELPASGSIEVEIPSTLEPSGDWSYFKVFTNARVKLVFEDSSEERVTVPVQVYRDWQWHFVADPDPLASDEETRNDDSGQEPEAQKDSDLESGNVIIS